MKFNLLAPYATRFQDSRGRLHPEEKSKYRTPFQRDKDRILHSTAFRRLKDKTQVLFNPQSAHTRTRLTHSLEVSQIARTLARFLNVDEDLTETIAIAHDLGHPPFGHVGEDALQDFMQPYGGFDHNDQALRVVTVLEKTYPEWDGLNLTWETLEALVKHNGPITDTQGKHLSNIIAFNETFDLSLNQHTGVEGQIVAIADDVAYNHHDIEDGLDAGYFTLSQIGENVPHVQSVIDDVNAEYTALDPITFRAEVKRRLMGKMVQDVLTETGRRITLYAPESVEQVRELPDALVAFSPKMEQQEAELKSFLFTNLYRHNDMLVERDKAYKQVTALAEYFMHHPESMDADIQVVELLDGDKLARTVLDYMACMTDRDAYRLLQAHNL